MKIRTSAIAAGLVAIATLLAGCAGLSSSVSGHGSVGAHAAPAAVKPKPPPAATAAPASFSALFAKEHSGVVRIEVVGCDDGGIGTGFLLSPNLVLTVDHVINQSVVVSLIDGKQRTTGTVIGTDPGSDLALVRSAIPLTGYHFHLAPKGPAVGDAVAAIGFPVGDPITLTQGHISGLGRNIVVEGAKRTNMIETDTAINPGNSGGPLLDQSGRVVGLVDAKNTSAEGIGFAVPATQAAAAVPSWQTQPAQPAASCSAPLGPGQQTTATVTPPSTLGADAAGVATAFGTYFDGINTGDYAAAYAVLDPNNHPQSGYPDFANGDSTSYDSDFRVLDAHRVSADRVKVALSFVSIQRSDKGPNGDVCDTWSLNYTMVRLGSSWYIHATTPYGGGANHVSC